MIIGQPNTDVTLSQLRLWLEQSEIGSRLPPERKLAQSLDVSRPELRKALAILELEGRIKRQVGRGTFINQVEVAPPLTQGISGLTERAGPHDVMMARLSFEPELAHLAALHASRLQISQARDLAVEIRGAKDWETYETLDHALHDLIAQSTGNVLLHELHKVMNAVRKVVVWRKLSQGKDGPAPDYHSFDEHDAIIDAIARRDRAAARTAMRAHLTATLNAMTAED